MNPNLTEAYRFFIIAFGGAPGVTFRSQLSDAVTLFSTVLNPNAVTLALVTEFIKKPQFTSQYPSTLSNVAFSEALINSVTANSGITAASRTLAVNQLTEALNFGLTRDQAIFNVFNNLKKGGLNDVAGGQFKGVVDLIENQIKVAEYHDTFFKIDSLDITVLRTALAGVTNASAVGTDAQLAALLSNTVAGNNLMVGTTGADTLIGGNGQDTLTGNAGNDIFSFGPGQSTLTAPDRITDFTAAPANAVANGDKIFVNTTGGLFESLTIPSANLNLATAKATAELRADNGVKFVFIGGATSSSGFLFVDTNGDRDLTGTNDIAIEVVGTNVLRLTDLILADQA